MFRYLISPESPQQYLAFSSITVSSAGNDTINVFDQKATHSTPNALQTSREAGDCLEYYFANTHKYSFMHFDHPDHHLMHSSDTTEVEQSHYHLRSKLFISVASMDLFLKSITQCQAMTHLPKDHAFFTAAITKDISKKYKEYRQQNDASQLFIASNNPMYNFLYANKLIVPSIKEHATCLQNGLMGCSPENPFMPEFYELEQNAHALSQTVAPVLTPEPYRIDYDAISCPRKTAAEDTMPTSIAAIVVLGIFALKHLNRKMTKTVTLEPEQSFESKIKSSLAKLT